MPKPPDNNASNAFALMACEDTIADITPETPRDDRIAAAIALVEMGSSVNNAAEATFLAPRTVWDRVYKDPKAKDAREEYIENQAFEGVVRAGEKIMELIESNSMRPAEVIKAYDVLRTTVAKRRKWDAPPPAPEPEKQKTALQTLVEYAERLREERDRGVIDVTPKKEETDD